MSRQPRLYTDLAYLWPLLSPPEDYVCEAELVREIIDPYVDQTQATPTLMELGAGGGHTLCHLVPDYQPTAVDLSPEMLELCQQLVPNVEIVVGDMRDVRLDRAFDAILIHDAIDYLLTAKDVLLTLQNAAQHLRAGQPLLIAPTYIREMFTNGDYEADQSCFSIPSMNSEDDSAVWTLTYLSYVSESLSNADQLDMHLVYVIDRDGQVEVVHDPHTCGLFARDQWLGWLEEAGFEPEFRQLSQDEQDMPWQVFLGIKR